jgi:hypothetical protein
VLLWTRWWTFGFHKQNRTFLIRWVTISFSNNILHPGVSNYPCTDINHPKWLIRATRHLPHVWGTADMRYYTELPVLFEGLGFFKIKLEQYRETGHRHFVLHPSRFITFRLWKLNNISSWKIIN